MVTKLAETLAEGLEQSLLFEELVQRVKREAEAEFCKPCMVTYHAVAKGQIQPLDTFFVVVVGEIKKRRQEPVAGGAD
jgi:hypothetical protein